VRHLAGADEQADVVDVDCCAVEDEVAGQQRLASGPALYWVWAVRGGLMTAAFVGGFGEAGAAKASVAVSGP
jgi:hypothetical protein